MNKLNISKPFIRAGWLRALLYLISFLLVASTAAAVFIVRFLKSDLNIGALKEMLKGDKAWMFVLMLFILTLIITFVFRRWVDRKTFISLGLQISGRGSEIAAGLSFSIFIICLSTMILKMTGHLKWMDILFDPRALFTGFITVLLIAFYEELIFRGYLLNNLMDSFPRWVALAISAFAFMVFHWTTTGFFPMINTLILGLILGMSYLYTKNLWFSIFFHTGWKFFQGPVLGFSGDDSFQTLLQAELNGDANITGGTNGLEGSMILTIMSLLSLIAFYLVLQRKSSQRSLQVPGRI